MDIETIKGIGAVMGVGAGLVALGERIVTFRAAYREKKRIARKKVADNVSPLIRRPSFAINFLFRQEIAVILATAVLINFVALALSTRLTSILYLDMTGTAVAALLLGPWYGAIAGLISGGFVNWILFAGQGGYDVFPYAIVNIFGGLLWGFFGRNPSFSKFMSAGALRKAGTLALDPEIANALDKLLMGSIDDVKQFLSPLFGEPASNSIAHWAIAWAQNTARYIPDKTLSFAIAMVAIKVGFPLFEKELIHSRINASPSAPGWLDPAVLIAMLVPYTLGLLIAYNLKSYWPLWTSPIVVACFGLVFEYSRSRIVPARFKEKVERESSYIRASELLPRDAPARLGPNFVVACLTASLLFVLVLPLLVPNYLRIAFNFFCLVYGFQLLIYLYSVALSQNLAAGAEREQFRPSTSKVG